MAKTVRKHKTGCSEFYCRLDGDQSIKAECSCGWITFIRHPHRGSFQTESAKHLAILEARIACLEHLSAEKRAGI